MSVFQRGTGRKRIYSTSFQIDGVTFFKSTGKKTKREARQFEAEYKKVARRLVDEGKARRGATLTFDAALGLLWDQVGQHYTGTYRATFETSLEWLLEKSGIPASMKLEDIGTAKISEAIARRRGDGVANATVNRTVTEPLRMLFIRARRLWEQPVKEFRWRDFLLGEPKERIVSLKLDDQPKLMAALEGAADYIPAVLFKIKSGFRKREVVNLRKDDIDWGGRTITVRGKGRGGKPKEATIPLGTELRELLWPICNDPANKTDYVFTFAAKRPVNKIIRHKRGDGTFTEKTYKFVRGQRYRISYSGFGTAWRRYGPSKAGINDFHLHDCRHTTATRLFKAGANLKVVQKLLRHEDIASTVKYQHVFDEDLMAAMEAETKARQAAELQQAALHGPLQAPDKTG